MAMDKKSRDSKNNLQNRVLGETFNKNHPMVKGFSNTFGTGRYFGKKSFANQNHNIWIPFGNYQKVPYDVHFS